MEAYVVCSAAALMTVHCGTRNKNKSELLQRYLRSTQTPLCLVVDISAHACMGRLWVFSQDTHVSGKIR